MPIEALEMGDANAEVNSFLTGQVHVGIELVLSSPLGRLASNPQEHICTQVRIELRASS
jgi:hypothetical protein